MTFVSSCRAAMNHNAPAKWPEEGEVQSGPWAFLTHPRGRQTAERGHDLLRGTYRQGFQRTGWAPVCDSHRRKEMIAGVPRKPRASGHGAVLWLSVVPWEPSSSSHPVAQPLSLPNPSFSIKSP